MLKKGLVLIVFLSSIVWANGLKNFADGVVSVKESGGAISTRDRTVLFGGGYTMKTPNIRLTPFNVTAPSLKAGCGGIDMVFGSLGFLSKDQFVKFAENILKAAPGVAFDLALKTLCPSCSDTLKALQAMANQINNMGLDSCQAATALGNMALDAVAGNNTKEDLKDNSVNNFFQGLNESYLKPATKHLQKFNNTLDNIGSGDPLYRPKMVRFLAQTSKSGDNDYLLNYMFGNVSYISGLDYNILRTLFGDIKIKSFPSGDRATVVTFLPPLDEKGSALLSGKDEIKAFQTNTENIIQRLIGGTEKAPIIYNSGDETQQANTASFPIGTLHKEYSKKVENIIKSILNRQAVSNENLEFLGRFNFPVYKIFNTLGNNEFTLGVLESTSDELATMLGTQILYELIIQASFEIQKRISELDTYASETPKLPITNKEDLREYLQQMSAAARQAAGVSYKIYQQSYSAFLTKLNTNESINTAKKLKELVMVRTNPDILNNLEFAKTINK